MVRISQAQADGSWLEIPLPKAVTRGIAYHYTNPAGLVGIVKEDELWASSALSLNDTSELSYGYGVLEEAARDRNDTPSLLVRGMLETNALEDFRSAAHVLSATSDGDALTQWVHYGGRQGYAIGLRMNGRLAPLRDETLDEPLDAPQPLALTTAILLSGFSGWHRVIYKREKQLQLTRRLLDFCCEHRLLESEHSAINAYVYFGLLLPVFKHEAFKDERELRFITSRPPGAAQGFRPGRFGVVPFVRLVQRMDPEGVTSAKAGPLPIASVRVGPANAGERPLIAATTRMLLSRGGYESASVEHSDVPYRF